MKNINWNDFSKTLDEEINELPRDFMTEKEYLSFNFIKKKYSGIYEIYPTKATNTEVLNKVIYDLQKHCEIVKITNDWYRAFVNED